jgi:hypothetical protein
MRLRQRGAASLNAWRSTATTQPSRVRRAQRDRGTEAGAALAEQAASSAVADVASAAALVGLSRPAGVKQPRPPGLPRGSTQVFPWFLNAVQAPSATASTEEPATTDPSPRRTRRLARLVAEKKQRAADYHAREVARRHKAPRVCEQESRSVFGLCVSVSLRTKVRSVCRVGAYVATRSARSWRC